MIAALAGELERRAKLFALDHLDLEQPLDRPADLRLVDTDRGCDLRRHQRPDIVQQEQDAPVQFGKVQFARVGHLSALADLVEKLPQVALDHLRRGIADRFRRAAGLLQTVEHDIEACAEFRWRTVGKAFALLVRHRAECVGLHDSQGFQRQRA